MVKKSPKDLSQNLYRGDETDPYTHHKAIYDLIDLSVKIRQETLRLSKIVDTTYTLTNAQQGLLGMIYRYEGATVTELSAIYQRDSKNLIKAVTQMEQRGLVKRSLQPQSKRKALYLTEAGKTMNNELMVMRGKLIEHLLMELPRESLEAARQTMEGLLGEMTAYIDHL